MGRERRVLVLLLVATTASSALHAQRVQLELRPSRGDTLNMRLDQSVEMSGARRGATSRQMKTSLVVFSRAIVERVADSGTIILAVTDSVQVAGSDEQTIAVTEDVQRQLRGQRMRMWLAPDGTVELLDAARQLPREVTDLVSVMPGSFPTEPVAVGDTWTRVMPVPPAARMGLPLGGAVRATFRLDSLSSAGDFAFLSLRGNLRQDSESGGDDPALLAGSVSGSMIMDRRRGWLSESRFLIQMRATVRPAQRPDARPVAFTMRVSQHMRVIDGARTARR
jgi:hypothetical protein